MRLVAKAVVAVLITGLWGSGPSALAATGAAERSGARWRVEVLTMGPGKATWSRFGHSAIRIRDLQGTGDLVFNFGTFDHEQPGVVRRFLQGRLAYWLGVSTFAETFQEYRAAGRQIWSQELSLTQPQTIRLFKRLRHLARPEHRHYRYDHFVNNCSTRIRDELDRVTGGLLRRQLGQIPAGTYRTWIRRATRNAPGFHLGFDLILSQVDRPITWWEACYAPERLKAGLGRVRIPGPQGRTWPFVRRTRILSPGPPFSAGEGLSPLAWLMVSQVGLVLLLLLPLIWRGRTRWPWRLAGAATVCLGLASAAVAAVLIGLWIFATLPAFQANQNLLLFPPSHAILIYAGARLCWQTPRGWGVPKWLVGYAVAHAGLAVGYRIIQWVQTAPQQNSEYLVISVVWTTFVGFVFAHSRRRFPREIPDKAD